MKRLVFVSLLFFGMCIFLSSCSKEENYSALIIGKWKSELFEEYEDGVLDDIDYENNEDVYLTFDNSGQVLHELQYIRSGYYTSETFKYTISGNRLYFTFEDEDDNECYEIVKLTSSELVIYDLEDDYPYDYDLWHLSRVK